MCVPAIAGAAIMLGGSVLSGIGSMKQGDAVADAERYNIGIAENDIRQVTAQAEEQKQSMALESMNQLAQGRTSLAAGNVAVGTGTAADWQSDVGMALESDISTVDRSLGRKVAGIRMGQSLSEARANSAKKAGRYGFASSIISGASKSALSFT